MPFNPEDPKWTAYVLDELTAVERAAVEQELTDSAEARELVSELRETTHLLETKLQREPTLNLSAEQRAIIASRAETKVSLGFPSSSRRRRLAEWAAAAAVLLALGALLLPATQSAREAARRNPSATSTPQTVNSQRTLTSPHYLQDDVQYAAPSPEVGYQSRSVKNQVDPDATLADFDALAESISTTNHANSRDWAEPTLRSKLSAAKPSDEYTTERGSLESLRSWERRPSEGDRSGSGKQGSGLQANRIGAADGVDAYKRVFGFSLLGTQSIEAKEGESYDSVTDNPFWPARENPLSTFSIDVDTASYSNIRRFLTQNNALPPKGAVRIEEMINYFRYDYPQPEGDVPFSVTTEVAGCPWNAGHRLVRIGLKGREIAPKKRPRSNLVFLLDVSGSMTDANKLPLVREAMKLLVEQLTENDHLAIVVYAGNSGLVLPSTTGDKQREIREAIDQLEAGGSTNGGEGIQLAYDLAAGNFIKGDTNRVILATDGDFNVGITNRDDLIKLITEKAQSGVFLTTLGFGMGNLKDATLEQLADKGNGNYAYIDDLREAKKVFVEQMNGTLITIAKDVKIQIEFNPAEVASYRLIGYENRILAHQDFNDDKKDAGEIGSGHTVTALYEIAPAAGAAAEGERPKVDPLGGGDRPAVDPLKYQKPKQPVNDERGELLTLKLRYKQPDGDTSKLIETPVVDSRQPYGKATADFKFAAAVGLFGMILRDSPHKGTGTIDAAAELAREGLSKDDGGYRTEFLELIKRAKELGTR